MKEQVNNNCTSITSLKDLPSIIENAWARAAKENWEKETIAASSGTDKLDKADTTKCSRISGAVDGEGCLWAKIWTGTYYTKLTQSL